MLVQLIVLSSCAICKLIGELWWHNAQRFIMPVIIAVGVSLVSHVWWLGLTCLPMIAPLCLGYDDYGKWSDGFNRAMWLGMILVTAGLGCAIAGYILWFSYIPWCILGFVWGGISRAWNNKIVAPITGLLIGSLILLVR